MFQQADHKYAASQAMQSVAASIGGGKTAERMPELPSAADRLSTSIERLYDLADRLDNRLTGPVARPAGPQEAGNLTKPVMNTGFGAQLDGMNDRAIVIESRLRGLLDRLEF